MSLFRTLAAMKIAEWLNNSAVHPSITWRHRSRFVWRR